MQCQFTGACEVRSHLLVNRQQHAEQQRSLQDFLQDENNGYQEHYLTTTLPCAVFG